jgi:hypothetical protein
MRIAEYVRHQQTDLVAEMRGDGDASHAALDSRQLRSLLNLRRVEVARMSPSRSTIVLKFPGLLPQLWARSSSRNYRRAFSAFLRAEYGVVEPIPPHLDVDHVSPRHRTRGVRQVVYLRLLLLPSAVNRTYGASFERRFYRFDRYLTGVTGTHLTLVQFLKVMGHPVPDLRPRTQRWDRWAEGALTLLSQLKVLDVLDANWVEEELRCCASFMKGGQYRTHVNL